MDSGEEGDNHNGETENGEMSNQTTPCSPSSIFSGTKNDPSQISANDSAVEFAHESHENFDSSGTELSLNLLQDTTLPGGEDFRPLDSEIQWNSSDWPAIPNFTFDEQQHLPQTGPLLSWTDVSGMPMDLSTVQSEENTTSHLVDSDNLESCFRPDLNALESHPFPALMSSGEDARIPLQGDAAGLSVASKAAGAEDGTKGSVTLILSHVNADIARDMIEEVMRHNANLKIQIVTD